MCSGWCNNWVTRQHARCNNENKNIMFKISRKIWTNDCKSEPRIYCTNIDRNILGITHRKSEGNASVFARGQDKLFILGRTVGKLITLLTGKSNRVTDTNNSLVRFRRRNYGANKFDLSFFTSSLEEIKVQPFKYPPDIN